MMSPDGVSAAFGTVSAIFRCLLCLDYTDMVNVFLFLISPVQLQATPRTSQNIFNIKSSLCRYHLGQRPKSPLLWGKASVISSLSAFNSLGDDISKCMFISGVGFHAAGACLLSLRAAGLAWGVTC